MAERLPTLYRGSRPEHSTKKDDMSYQDRGGSVERARADHKIKAAEAEQRARLKGRQESDEKPSPTVIERLRSRLRRG